MTFKICFLYYSKYDIKKQNVKPERFFKDKMGDVRKKYDRAKELNRWHNRTRAVFIW